MSVVIPPKKVFQVDVWNRQQVNNIVFSFYPLPGDPSVLQSNFSFKMPNSDNLNVCVIEMNAQGIINLRSAHHDFLWQYGIKAEDLEILIWHCPQGD